EAGDSHALRFSAPLRPCGSLSVKLARHRPAIQRDYESVRWIHAKRKPFSLLAYRLRELRIIR
ncbi:MAG TPA: hypothetical protein VMT98_08490, partial [Verrucomicrobiae bacterium]|nr:hypothetical protein [Verrucomicrobiae bacterium]